MSDYLSLKSVTADPADGISNFLKNTFGKVTDGPRFFARHIGVSPSGLLTALTDNPFLFMWRKHPRIIFGTGYPGDFLYALAHPRDSKYVINFHSVLYRGKDSPWSVRTPWFLRQFLFSRAALIICPSNFSASSVSALLPTARVVSILNGVDLEAFSPKNTDRKKLDEVYGILNDGVPLISFVGSLHHRKRPEVVEEIARRFPEVRFIFVGREVGEYDPQRLKELPNVIWISKMSREDVATLLASSAALIFPSLHDASAAVILEAMASGCIPVVSRSGGSTEFFQEAVSGFSVPINDQEIDLFCKKIRAITGDSAVRAQMSIAARNEAEKHPWGDVAREYLRALQEASLTE